MKNPEMETNLSVDCVLIGFDGDHLCTLLVRQLGADNEGSESEFKLPGSLLFKNEELDDAAKRVISELTGLRNLEVHQFQTFGSPSRIINEKDRKWLSHFYGINSAPDRVVTVAYTTLLKIERKHLQLSDAYEACWVPVPDVPCLAFDHNKILKSALQYVRTQASVNNDFLFHLLPRKFTALQLRKLFQEVFNRDYDLRNFHKLIARMEHVIPLDEYETGVAHRAARYYKYGKRNKNKND